MAQADDLQRVYFSAMRWNTPLSEGHADALLHELDLGPAQSVLDLGCGWGELLMRALEAAPGARGTGVDTAEDLLEIGRALALRRGLEDRLSFVNAPAQEWSESAQRIICIGSTHAWGATRPAVAALAELVTPGCRLVLGDAFWERSPSDAAVEIFGDGVLTLPELTRAVAETGLRVLHMTVADQREWDEFESTFRAGRERWLMANSDDPRVPDLARHLEERLQEYLEVYREVLGLCYLVLGR